MSQVDNPLPTKPRKRSDRDLNDMLQELRVLLQGAQVLVGFLIILPFNQSFSKIDANEKLIYLFTFIFAIASLIAFSTPAAYHRIRRPIHDKVAFKDFSTRMIIAGLASLTVALGLATHFVVREATDLLVANIVTTLVVLAMLIMWWALPIWSKIRNR